MPGANQLAIFDHPLGQRASTVRAFVVQSADYPVDVGNTQCPGPALNSLASPGRGSSPLAQILTNALMGINIVSAWPARSDSSVLLRKSAGCSRPESCVPCHFETDADGGTR